MTRLDHDRALSQLSTHLKCSNEDITDFCIWGNHSPTMFPDTTNLKVKGKSVDVENDFLESFIPRV